MPGISGFEYDIFISYAHVDNEPFAGPGSGWVERFHVHLEGALKQIHSTRDLIKIWRDERQMNGSTLFDGAIAEALDSSAVCLVLHSHKSQTSDYCRQEREAFHQKIQTDAVGPSLNQQSRLIPIHLYAFPHTTWPTEFEGLTGFNFYEPGAEASGSFPMEPGHPQYIPTLRQLAGALLSLLKSFPKPETSQAPPAADATGPATGPTLWFGDVSPTLKKWRTRAEHALSQKGYTFLPKTPPPYGQADHEAAVREALAQADLTVHLFDEYEGNEIEGQPERYYGPTQATWAIAAEKEPLIWLPKRLSLPEVEDPTYRAFLEGLENGTTHQAAYRLLRESPSALAHEIDAYWQARQARQTRQAAHQAHKVLVDTHFVDHKYALALHDLFKNSAVEHEIVPVADDVGQNLTALEKAVSEVGKLVLLFGQIPKAWVQSRLEVTLNLISELNLQVKELVVLALPEQKAEPDFWFSLPPNRRLQVLDNSDRPELKPEVVAQLIGGADGH